MAETFPAKTSEKTTTAQAAKTYTRFDLSQRIEHIVLLVSFTILGITGLAQKYASSPAGESVLGLLGGIEVSRIIHRTAAVVLLGVSIYHIVAVLYRVMVKNASLSMVPVPQDFVHLYQDILYYLGRRARQAYYGRYTYAEKVEYFAVVWGTVIMAITGFMMWNPIATTRFLPGEAIPAAKAAHGGEALLAVLAIILWHFYHVHIRHFNKSMFTGKLTEEEMQHEHPAELAEIQAGEAKQAPPEEVVRKRRQRFIPIAAALVAILGFGLFKFVTFEETALATIPRGETVPVFVPITPTPTPTPLPSPTPLPGETTALGAWEDASLLLDNRCRACHVQDTAGGLSLATYQDALEGGNRGPAIVPGNPEASLLVQVQNTGTHPGQLSQEELEAMIGWISSGAREK